MEDSFIASYYSPKCPNRGPKVCHWKGKSTEIGPSFTAAEMFVGTNPLFCEHRIFPNFEINEGNLYLTQDSRCSLEPCKTLDQSHRLDPVCEFGSHSCASDWPTDNK
ncbi:UNVERIFIED_CONTAM: hypothetical protein K2H54_066144 [Gekko kuhli]